MQARTLFQRSNETQLAVWPIAGSALRASRTLMTTALDTERPAWERFSPVLLLALVAALPLIVVASGAGPLSGIWLAGTYLLAGAIWVERAFGRADRSHQWRAYALTCAGLGVISFLLPATAGAIVACLLGLSAVAAVVFGIRLHLPTRIVPWYLLATALGLAWAGQTISVVATITSDRQDAPPVAGLISLAGMALLAVTGWLILHRRARGSAQTGLLDTAILTTGLGMLTWVYLIAPHFTEPLATPLERAVSIGWPLAGLAILTVVIRLLVTRWPTDVAARQIAGAGLILLIAAIAATAWIAAGASEPASHPGMSFAWLLAVVGLAVATLHPSMVQLAEPVHEQPIELDWQRILLLTLALLMAPVALLAQLTRGDRPTIEVIAAGTALLGLLVAARIVAIQRSRAATSAVERSLRLAATDLVVTHGRDAIIESAIDAARAIGGATTTTALYLSDGVAGEFIYLTDTGAGDGASRVVRERDLPRVTRRTLAAGASAWLIPDDIAGARDVFALAGHVALVAIAPVCGNPDLRGLLVSFGTGLTPEVARGQETLGALLALALDRQALADELGYQPGQQRYRAQAADGTSFTFVSVPASEPDAPELDTPGDPEPTLRDALRAAIDDDQLIARFQPRLDLAQARITAVEMNAAWESPLVGPIPRDALAAIADEHRLSQPLRSALLLRACRQAIAWQARHPGRTLDVVLPLSLADIETPGLADDVALALAEHDCDPSRLVLGFSVVTLLAARDTSLAELTLLSAAGVQLAASEAGASWSDLERLSALPIGIIELEGSLVSRIDTDERAAAIAQRVIVIAHARGARVVAHGIERRETWVALRKLNCDLGQGALFSPPIDADAVSALLNRAQQRTATP